MTALTIYEDPAELTDEAIEAMTLTELINNAILTYDISEPAERVRIQSMMIARGDELKNKSLISRLFSGYDKENNKLIESKREYIVDLEKDGKGAPKQSIENFSRIMLNDPFYSGVRFNLLSNYAEIHDISDGVSIRPWSDTDDAESQRYIESQYNIYHERKHAAALRVLFRARAYNPIMDIVDNLEWDGVERCTEFLTKWAKADDTPYVREVSRLIFAGGINRLYLPGCKFDDVPILIGTSQGEGKSTLVKWLAINDSYFAEVKEIEGQKGVEALSGAWICEIAELLALTKVKEQEAVKSYITTQRDKYRVPYDKSTTELPRRCIFIGTTNNENFLRDKTGNRRFYPVTVHSNGYDLYDHEEECREYIKQCWAEAREKYRRGEMPNFADKSLLAEYKTAQDNAMEDDWRVGVIEAYLDRQEVGDFVCIAQIKRDALSLNHPDYTQDLDPKESQEIATIMSKIKGWERAGLVYTRDFGRQRCWRKVGAGSAANTFDALPF